MPPRPVLTLGNFDGPHIGHLAIVRHARQLAAAHGDRVVAITFDPPPVAVLRPGTQPPRLTPLAQRITALREAGADEVRVVEPTTAWLARSAERFVMDLVQEHHPRAIVEGPDFRFGAGRAGDMTLLQQLGPEHGFTAVVVPRVEVTLADLQVMAVSSSLVRWLVGHGRVADAATCLGRPFGLTAPVVRGEQRGRLIDVPTANLDTDALAEFIIPANGVYAGYVIVEGVKGPGGQGAEGPRGQGAKGPDSSNQQSAIIYHQSVHSAAISIGVKPTFGRRSLTVEAHLLDFRGDLYGRTITLHFTHWLRDQAPFPGITQLKLQLRRDIAAARRLTVKPHPTQPA